MSRNPEKNAASSASGRRARTSPSSPTTACTRCSTAARKPPASRSPTGHRYRRLQGSRPGQPGFRRADAGVACRATSPSGTAATPPPGGDLGERPAGVPQHHGRHRAGAGAQRQPGQHRASCHARRAAELGIAEPARCHHRLRHVVRAAGPRRRRLRPGTGRAGTAADRARRVLPGVLRREHPVRGTRPARRAAAGARPAGPRLGGRLARPPRWTSSAPRSCARSSPANCWPSTPTACGPAGSRNPSPKGCVFEYVYLARPDTTIAGRGVHATRRGDRPPAGPRASRSTPTW